MDRRKLSIVLSLLVAAAALSWGIEPRGADAAPALQAGPNGYYIPDYFTTPNWANSPPLAKFVDPLPGLGDAGLPIARPDVVTYPGSDYYEITLRQYTQKMHRDLGATTLRGYVQVNNGTDTTGGCVVPPAVPGPGQTACTASDNTLAPASIRYLGPVIVAQKGRPLRIKFTNELSGDLFLPVDTSIMGSGAFEINYDPETKAPAATRTGMFSQSRATLHLHGGLNPWISDGTTHQWTVPVGDLANLYPKGVSVAYVPDMWFDAATGATIAACAGQTTCAVAGATNNPGPGKLTFFWTNDQSARFMFYHDHAYGITRLNVYAGEAAGYLINDPALEDTLAGLGVPGTLGTSAVTTDLAHLVPLVIQDKTFVDASTIMTTDPTWAWGSNPGKPVTPTPVTGDLWWPHVYMPAQNPYNPNLSGINDMGRWHYGPWFFPPTPVCGSSPDAVKPFCIDFGAVANVYCLPVPGQDCSAAPDQPPFMPGTPIPSWGAEAFLDTMVVNGAAYPTLTVDPTKYRLRILNAAHDRFLNLQLYRAVSKTGYTNPTVAPYDFTGTGPADLTEVAMVPAAAAAGFPATWPTDGREGGVPDPTTRGPAFIQIGTEGGVLPVPVALPNQPVQWNMDPTMFNVGNVLQQRDGGGTLFLAPAERADVIVDFSKFAGQTLILYNDAPTAFPALDPHYDYYTGAPDRTDIGGYGPVLPGVGPNIRTVMQIVVNPGADSSAPPDDHDAILLGNLVAAFASPTGIFASNQHPVVAGQTAYNSAYSHTFPATWPNWGLSTIFDDAIGFETVNPDGTFTLKSNFRMERKAIHDEMGATFDDYGRMSAKLGLEVPFANAANQNFVLQNFVDPPTELVAPGEIQIWRITHNGVDTHPIHFHLFDVQVLNRVGWDGFIRLPDDNELGWKDTVRISPLEDTIVALRPVLPPVPFQLPNSVRPLNPTMPLGDTTGFSQIDITDGADLVPPMTNQLLNFGWEYTWHCHILSHEENDMMRAIAMALAPTAPENLVATLAGNGNNRRTVLTWTDTSVNETSFTIQRATDLAFAGGLTAFTVGPNVTTYSDTIGNTNQTYYYRVFASNTVGSVFASASNTFVGPATSYPTKTADSGFSNTAGVNLPPAAPSNVRATAARFNTTSDRVTVTWTDNSTNENGFRIRWGTDPAFPNGTTTGTVNPNVTTFTTGNLPRGSTLYFQVQSFNNPGASAWVNATPFPITTP